MAAAAAAFVASLDEAQRHVACRPFADTFERRRWYYTPTDHGGLPLAAMRPRHGGADDRPHLGVVDGLHDRRPGELEVVLAREILGKIFAMLLWADKRITAKRWVLAEEDDRLVVLVDDMMVVGWIAADELADEAGPRRNVAHVTGKVEWLALVHDPSSANKKGRS